MEINESEVLRIIRSAMFRDSYIPMGQLPVGVICQLSDESFDKVMEWQAEQP